MQLAEFEETRGGAKGGRWGREGKEVSIRALFASGLCVWFVCYIMLGFVLNNMQCMYAWERLHTFG